MYKIILPVLMGLESIIGDELETLGFSKDSITKDNASVSVTVEEDKDSISIALAKCNIYLRTAERVELEIASKDARDFDELFASIQTIAWEDWIPQGAAFTIKGFNRKSQLFANSSIQGTIKKAIVLRLQKAWGLTSHSTIEENPDFLHLNIHYALMNDVIHLRLDSSGQGLHKRAYRLAHNEAPIKETLAAGILAISQFEAFSGELLYDPCCGSGTFLIEAAMKAANIAPGAHRKFSCENWPFINQEIFKGIREEAIGKESTADFDEVFLAGSDLNPQNIRIARENARRAGVEQLIDFSVRDLFDLNYQELLDRYQQDKVLFVANPPYGDRMSEEKEVEAINKALGRLAFYPKSSFTNPNCRLSVITTVDFEHQTGHKADKRRKLYNGMKKATLYHYFRAKYLR